MFLWPQSIMFLNAYRLYADWSLVEDSNDCNKHPLQHNQLPESQL